jgi:hypothetical protein
VKGLSRETYLTVVVPIASAAAAASSESNEEGMIGLRNGGALSRFYRDRLHGVTTMPLEFNKSNARDESFDT